MIAGENKNLLLNVNGRIVPASDDKVKPYGTRVSSSSPTNRDIDSVLEWIIVQHQPIWAY